LLGVKTSTACRKRLESVWSVISSVCAGFRLPTFVDPGPLLERAFAQRSVLVCGQKHMVITKRVRIVGLFSPRYGYGTLELVVRCPDLSFLWFPVDRIDACPTPAITAPGNELDARRCISYLTM